MIFYVAGATSYTMYAHEATTSQTFLPQPQPRHPNENIFLNPFPANLPKSPQRAYLDSRGRVSATAPPSTPALECALSLPGNGRASTSARKDASGKAKNLR